MNMESPQPSSARRPTPRKRCLRPLQDRKAGLIRHCSDRFIPDRGSVDWDVAQFKLFHKEKEKDSVAEFSPSPSKKAYKMEMAAALLRDANLANAQSNCRILAFKRKPDPASENLYENLYEDRVSITSEAVSNKRRRYIPQTSERTLDAPDLVDDYYLNLLDWSLNNVLAIALGNTVYLWNASDGSISELLSANDEQGPVTSINWATDGKHMAVGLNDSTVQLWDSASHKKLRVLKGHDARVGALAWNAHILTTGGRDGLIINHDVRVRDHIVQTYRAHDQEVCGLKWSLSGQHLASGGNDNLLFIWDNNMASSNSRTSYLHRLDEHCAAVKALAWCPFQSNLLASGGGSADRKIKFWNINTGACLNTVDTHSQVCALLWNRHERELLSSHGFSQNQLTLWKYPSMVKMADLTGHTSRVLHLAQSPDGYTVASAAGDETLRFWQVFGTPDMTKKVKNRDSATAFSRYLTQIR